jgi:hypothetical protein
MLQRRYPHTRAARLAAAAFLILGFGGGWFAAGFVPHGPGGLAGGIVWGLIAAGISYLVFASEGPARRPEIQWQATMADGLIAGTISGIAAAAIDVLVASGSSSGSSLSTGQIIATIAAFAGAGALIGALAGVLLGFLPSMQRLSPSRKKRKDKRYVAAQGAPSARQAASAAKPGSARKGKRR